MRKDYRNRRLGDSIVLAQERMRRLYRQETRLQKRAVTNYSHQQMADLTKNATKPRQRR